MSRDKKTGDMFDLAAARAARDEALERVLDPNDDWKTRCFKLAPHYPEQVFTGEALRLWLTEHAGSPHHHNAWGGLVNGLKRAGIIIDLNRLGQMKTKKSHARRTPLYRKPHREREY